VLHRNHRATGSIPAREPIVALSVTALSWPGLITLEISIYKILQQLISSIEPNALYCERKEI
jgi:hypothetical protein